MVDGKLMKLLVHRKGSTRAFPPHHPLIPVDYQLTGGLWWCGGGDNQGGVCGGHFDGAIWHMLCCDHNGCIRWGSATCMCDLQSNSIVAPCAADNLLLLLCVACVHVH